MEEIPRINIPSQLSANLRFENFLFGCATGPGKVVGTSPETALPSPTLFTESPCAWMLPSLPVPRRQQIQLYDALAHSAYIDLFTPHLRGRALKQQTCLRVLTLNFPILIHSPAKLAWEETRAKAVQGNGRGSRSGIGSIQYQEWHL